MNNAWINIAYVVAATLFILGLKGLTHPRTAVRGNMLGATGMLIAVVVTLWHREVVSFELIVLGVVLGGLVGAILAVKIAISDMPQLVALFNGFGGIASVLVAGAELSRVGALSPALQLTIATSASGLIGAVTFWGSLVAFGKLQGLISERSVTFKGQFPLNLLLLLVAVALGALIVNNPESTYLYLLLAIVSSVLGVTLVIPVGGADMPVVIALLNSYSGIAAASTGFVLGNSVLIIGGSLVGASGVILTQIMCKAMNRSLANVLMGLGQATQEGPDADEVYAGKIKSTSADELAMILDTAQRVMIVPGYGMAVAQAQHAVRDLTNLLESRGVDVNFGIHPVAGRMPGHMNVLLAEADIDYERLMDLDQANSMLGQTDVAIVIGANDVVNPVARTDPKSPIAGMPILDVDKARTVVVIKRSLSPGFAKIPNPLFAADNTLMFFSDAQKAAKDIIAALKDM